MQHVYNQVGLDDASAIETQILVGVAVVSHINIPP